jgi:arginine N-succinyltransferase
VLILRPIEHRDLDDLVALASQLDSVNLPSDRSFLSRRIEASERAFAQELDPSEGPVYVFALIDTKSDRCIGTSLILAKHGTPSAPSFWFEVSTEERHSSDLDLHFSHTKLRMRSTDDGPTEIGGLILDPAYRRHPQKCGKALSVVRFAFIGLHPDRFEREIIAEMLSPFEASGENLLWEAFGARFTGLSYREADHLSAHNKQFIADLFPKDPVYATLFPPEVQAAIGQPNDTAKAAVRILEKLGFHSLNQVDPFDGGPYLGAARDAITSVRERRELVLPGQAPESETVAEPEIGTYSSGPEGSLALLSAECELGFRATVILLDEEGSPVVSKERREVLGVTSGDRVSITPLP